MSLLSDSPDAVLACGFATPNVVKESAKKTNLTGCTIINLVNDGDFVPEVPLTKSPWNYTKYGNIIPFKVDFETELLFANYTGMAYTGMSSSDLKKLLGVFAKVAPSAEEFNAKLFEDAFGIRYSAQDYLQKGLAYVMIKGTTVKGVLNMIHFADDDNIFNKTSLRQSHLSELTWMLVDKQNSIFNDEILKAHQMETYLAYANTHTFTF